MSHGISGKVAIVTGAAGGIGRATALRFARAGADVVIADMDLNAAARWGEELTAVTVPDEVIGLGRRSFGFQGNLSDRASAVELVRRTVAELGTVDFIVNAAGGVVAPVDRSFASTTTDEDMELLFAANYRTVVNCCQAAAAHMRERRSGVIVNVTSGIGHAEPRGALAHYAFAKAAVTMFTRSLAGELGPLGVRANAIAPGTTMTARIAKLAEERGIGIPSQIDSIALRRFGTADDIAKVAEFLVSDLASFVTGQSIAVNGGWTLGPC